MDKKFIKSISEFYNHQRLLSFYEKREKSILIPHLYFYMDKMIKQRINDKNNDEVEISILDIGCGEGVLLKVINDLFKIRISTKYRNAKIKLYGWDIDKDVLSKAKKSFKEEGNADFEVVNLLKFDDAKYFGKFDLVLAVNTFHEVFSQFLIQENNGNSLDLQFNNAKKRLEKSFLQISNIINDQGMFVIFDGCDKVSEADHDKEVIFKIKNDVLKKYVKKMVNESKSLYQMKVIKITDDVFKANYRDFCRLVLYFKFLNTKIWEIEIKEYYNYFNLNDYKEVFKKMGMTLESINLITNDLGLYNQNFEIVSEGIDFPIQSALLVGSKKYIFSEFDYFCYDMQNNNR